eukprot:RCo055118
MWFAIRCRNSVLARSGKFVRFWSSGQKPFVLFLNSPAAIDGNFAIRDFAKDIPKLFVITAPLEAAVHKEDKHLPLLPPVTPRSAAVVAELCAAYVNHGRPVAVLWHDPWGLGMLWASRTLWARHGLHRTVPLAVLVLHRSVEQILDSAISVDSNGKTSCDQSPVAAEGFRVLPRTLMEYAVMFRGTTERTPNSLQRLS